MPGYYLHRILPHIKDTFSAAEVSISRNHTHAVIENLNHNFILEIEDNKIHSDDHFGFIKLKVPIENHNLNYERLVQFVSLMNHCHRGCHWAIDTMAENENVLYLYSTLITELGRRTDDKDQIVMEILNLQRMKYHTEQYLLDSSQNPQWFNQFMEIHGKTVIACLAPEHFLDSENRKIYQQTLEHILKLGYDVQKINNSSFKITNDKNSISILTFLGPELISLYGVITEENKSYLNLKKILNERNQDLLMGHFEMSPIQQIVGFTNYLRLAEGIRDIKMKLFLDSPDIAKMMYFENKDLAA